MPKRPSPWQRHVQRWKNCQQCNLCQYRKQVVLGKGQLPCDVLLLGEGPGESEDVIGVPFIGPAGKLLQSQVDEACRRAEWTPRMAFTNLVCCVPKDETYNKTGEPNREQIEACSERLSEFVAMAQPSTIVCVGALAKKHIIGQAQFGDCEWLGDRLMRFIDIHHPAGIMRANLASRGLMSQQCVVKMTEEFEELKEVLVNASSHKAQD